MPAGFFKASSVAGVSTRKSTIAKCGACGLSKTCQSPKIKVTGKGRKGILIVGGYPSQSDDEIGAPFTGDEGALLKRTLKKLGINMTKDCWLVHAVICRPKRNKLDPSSVEYCQPNLLKTIKELQPVCIIPMGIVAIKSLISSVWKNDVGTIDRWLGWTIPLQEWNKWICPNYGIDFVYSEASKHKPNKMPLLLFEKYLAKAIELSVSTPWSSVPDYKKYIDVIRDPKKAADVIYKMIERPGDVAFDFETNMLKPDHPKSEIVSCSICHNGNKTIAYPWHGEAIKATRKLIRSPHRKIASNLKFEDRWCRAQMGTRVRNWHWDTMISAHVINNASLTTSVKFQAFVLLGFGVWDEHIAPFLKGKEKGGYSINRIREIELGDLLLYNGLDSLIEYLVWKKQEEVYGNK